MVAVVIKFNTSFLYYTLGAIFMPVVLLYFNVGYNMLYIVLHAGPIIKIKLKAHESASFTVSFQVLNTR